MSTHEIEQQPPLSAVVAANIRAETARRGWTGIEFAMRMGMGRVAVSERNTGRTPWTLDEMQKAADLFGLPLSELVHPLGLEPRTRWFTAAPARPRHLSVVPRVA